MITRVKNDRTHDGGRVVVFPGRPGADATKYDDNSQGKPGGDVQAALAGDPLSGSSEVTADEVREVVRGVLNEQKLATQPDLDKVVLKTIATLLTSFGIEEDDRKEVRADFEHLRKWRKSVEQAQSLTFKAIVTVIISGVIGAFWLGFKATLGK